MISLEIPSIYVGVRGLASIEIELTGANRDLHSGVYGGVVANPVVILAQMIASCFDQDQHIVIPGFYDDVLDVSASERKLMGTIPFDETQYKNELNVKALWGEKEYTPIERTSIRPTLDVNGIWGGYTGEGEKTVLPSKAAAKITTRLVPNQSSVEITKKLISYFQQIAPPQCRSGY